MRTWLFGFSLVQCCHVDTRAFVPRAISIGRWRHGQLGVEEVSGMSCEECDRDPFFLGMDVLGIAPKSQESIREQLEKVDLLQANGSSSNMILLARDFLDRPEVFASLLQSDFGIDPLVAHQTRAVVMGMLKRNDLDTTTKMSDPDFSRAVSLPVSLPVPIGPFSSLQTDLPTSEAEKVEEQEDPKFSGWKSSVVNDKAKIRRGADDHEYGLPADYKESFPEIAFDLDKFFKFMTQPTPYSQEDPIRPATAEVYVRHAKQFFGWYISPNNAEAGSEEIHNASVSIVHIIPNKEKESATKIIEFIIWLRSRDISAAYEANILRGIIKLLKFRFAQESDSDTSYGGKSFDDVPIIKEIRKIHRDANKRQRLAPRSSDEKQKWLSWPEYLQVVQYSKNELLRLIKDFDAQPELARRFSKNDVARKYCLDQKKIAESYQVYLILAFFANVPDRQRTIRELEIDRTFVKDEELSCWIIKHGPDDYKTGKSYGERPAMHLAQELTPAIDDFVENWRPSLLPQTKFFFVQGRTGKPMTADSVYQRVSRSCFKFTGKKTNPHLLRDMIVTHVRESDASEKQLEALAMYMGHSVQMQRTSYDRRTLSKKIAPAVELMQSINSASIGQNDPRSTNASS
jgi:integrase